MKHFAKLAACLIATLCAGAVFAQPNGAGAGSQPTTTPAAYVYVTTGAYGGEDIYAYSAASNGSLTPLTGSPINTGHVLVSMAHTKHLLFATDSTYVYSYSIASNGTINQEASIDAQSYGNYAPNGLESLFLDHTGSTLYAQEIDESGNNYYQAFEINHDTGVLTYLGSVDAGIGANFEPAFLGNNEFAYGTNCHDDSPAFYAYQRSSNGTLTYISENPPIPTLSNGSYCPYLAAADPASDLAIPLYPSTETGPPQPPAALSVYTADSSGNLTTNSTTENMPTTGAGNLYQVIANPAGNVLAVSGSTGLQAFHFNGKNPITSYTGMLTTNSVGPMFWDDDNHLYAVGSGKLYVYTITSTSNSQASGSPHTIPNASFVAVVSQ